MDQLEPAPAPRSHKVMTTIVVFGTLGITGAAAWLYFRAREPGMDEQTWDRLQPRRGAKP